MPSLTGISQIVCTQTKKNLIDNSASAWEQGNINTSGNNSVGNEYVRTIDYYEIKGGANYEISGIATPSTASDFRLFFYDASKTFISYKNYGSTPRTTPENACYFRLRNIGTGDMTNLQIEYGSTATTYEAYETPTVTTVSLGRTIYGGQADVVNGTGKSTHGKITVYASDNWQTGYYGAGYRYYISGLSDMKKGQDCLDDMGITGVRFNIDNSQRINAYCGTATGYDTVEKFKEALGNGVNLCYELATPEDFTFTPIIPTPKTALGTNNFWANEGDSVITYRREVE